MPHKINQSMLRPEFGDINSTHPNISFENGFHQPPGQMNARVERGRVGPKYESWSGSVQTTKPALRNCAPPLSSHSAATPPQPLLGDAPLTWLTDSGLRADADNEKTLHIP